MTLKIACVQMESGSDPFKNLEHLQRESAAAAARGAQLICFPENALFRGPKEGGIHPRASAVVEIAGDQLTEDSEFSLALAAFFKSLKVAVSVGSVLEKDPDTEKLFNTHLFVYPGGRIVQYRKIHLFDFTSQSGNYRESAEIEAGHQAVSVDYLGFKIGLSICYDLRFPELYRALTLQAACTVLLVPAAFTFATGSAHWHTLLRARAIENLAYVVAAAQSGYHRDSRGQELRCYGHALVSDPWGHVIAEAPEVGDDVRMVELDLAELQRRRQSLPCLSSTSFFQSILARSST